MLFSGFQENNLTVDRKLLHFTDSNWYLFDEENGAEVQVQLILSKAKALITIDFHFEILDIRHLFRSFVAGSKIGVVFIFCKTWLSQIKLIHWFLK